MKYLIIFFSIFLFSNYSFAQRDLLEGQPEQAKFQEEARRVLKRLIGDEADNFDIILAGSEEKPFLAAVSIRAGLELDPIKNPNLLLELDKGARPKLVLNTRLFSTITSEDDLAAVIAHEVGHVQQYSERQINVITQLGGSIWQELNADQRALVLLANADPPYNPNALVNFFRNMIARYGENKLSLKMSHPFSVVRISAMNNWLSQNMYKFSHKVNGKVVDGFYSGTTNLSSFFNKMSRIEGVINNRNKRTLPKLRLRFSVDWPSFFNFNRSDAAKMSAEKKAGKSGEKIFLDTEEMYKTLFKIDAFRQLPDAEKIVYIDNLTHIIDPNNYFIEKEHRYNVYEWMKKCISEKCDAEKLKELDPKTWKYSRSYFDDSLVSVSNYLSDVQGKQTKIMFEYLIDDLGYENNEAIGLIETNGFEIKPNWEAKYWRENIKTTSMNYETFTKELESFSSGEYPAKYGHSPTVMSRNLQVFIENNQSKLSVNDISNIFNSQNSRVLLRLLNYKNQEKIEANLIYHIVIKLLEGNCPKDDVCNRFLTASKLAEIDGNNAEARKLSWLYRHLYDYADADRRSLNLLNTEVARLMPDEIRAIIKEQILSTEDSKRLVHKIYMTQYMFAMPDDLLGEILTELDNETLTYFYSYKDFGQGMKLVNPHFKVGFQKKEFIVSKIIPKISNSLLQRRKTFDEVEGLLVFYNDAISYEIDKKRKEAFEEYFPESQGRFGPAYYTNLEKTEIFQKEIVERLKDLNVMPSDPEAFTDFFIKLTKNGVTPFTDELIQEALDDGLELSVDQMNRIFSKQRVWDFSTRQRLFEKVAMMSEFEELKQGDKLARTQKQIQYIKRRIKVFYPEPSIERDKVLDRFLWKVNAGDEVIEAASGFFSTSYEFKNTKIGLAYLYNRVYGLLLEEAKELSQKSGVDENPKIMHQFVMYMLGDPNYPAPEYVKSEIIKPIGESRFKRLFNSLSYGTQAALLSTFFEEPYGILSSKEYTEKVINHTVRNLGEHKQTAKEIIQVFSESFQLKQPYRQSLFLSYILANSNNTANLSQGKQIKLILESIGPIGVSLGQKLYQFNIFDDPDINAELATLTYNAREVSKAEVNALLKDKLKIVGNVDDIIDYELMGDASSKIVVKLKYKDGTFPAEMISLSNDESEMIFKFLLQDYVSKANQDSELLKTVMDKLLKINRNKYAPLKVAIDAVIDGMLSQKDVNAEIKNKETFEKIYIGEDEHYRFQTVKSQNSQGIDGVFEEIAEGEVLAKCNCPNEIEQIHISIYDKDESNLVDNEAERIDFDYDRHDGNFIVQPRTTDEKGTITIIDHALSSYITKAEKEELFLAIGQLEVYRKTKNPLAKRDFINTIHKLAHSGGNLSGKPTKREIRQVLNSINLSSATNLNDLLTVFVSIQETDQISRIKKYVTALSHLKSHGEHKPKVDGRHVLDLKIENKVKGSLIKYQDKMNFLTRFILKCMN